MINQRLFDQYHIDTKKNLMIDRICGRPWDTLLIDTMGSCFVCECTSWLPQSIGNIQTKSIDDILKSDTRTLLQKSISDSSYRYCNNSQCSYIKSKRIYDVRQTFSLRLAIDDSCNLSCPSCRTHKIFISKGTALTRKKKWVDKIVKWISNQEFQIHITIGSDGDPFASLVYRYFMQQAEKHKWQHVTYDFQTNGLLVKKMYKRHKNRFDRTKFFKIRVEGATRSTYEELRRGAKWDQLASTFHFLSTTNRKFKVHLHMVVQKSNWKEMVALNQICKSFNFERIYFNLIQDWATGLDYKEQISFTDTDEFKNIVTNLQDDKCARLWQLS